MEEALEATGLWPMQEYGRRRHATIEDYIAARTIYEMYTRAERLQGTSLMMPCWYQDHIQVEGANGVSNEESGEVE